MPYKEKPIKQIRKTRAYSTTPRKRQIGFDGSERKTNKLDQVDLLCMVIELDVMTHLKKYCANEGLTELQKSEMIFRYNQYCDLYKKYPERRFQKGSHEQKSELRRLRGGEIVKEN